MLNVEEYPKFLQAKGPLAWSYLSKMSSRAAAWECSLQPLLHLPERDFPSILYPLPCDESVGESSSSYVQIPLDIAFPKGEEKQSVLKYLIDGSSRWIMEKTKQNKICFLITARKIGPIFQCAIITAERYGEDGIPEWEAYEVSLEKYAQELKGLEFALCLNEKLGNEEFLLNMVRIIVLGLWRARRGYSSDFLY